MSILRDLDTIARGCGFDAVGHVLTALDQRDPRPAATAHKFVTVAQEGSPADIRTADVGALPVVRYWTVKTGAMGRTYYVHVIACDAWKASLVALKRNPSAVSAEVVREIDREEFEHLTRVPA